MIAAALANLHDIFGYPTRNAVANLARVFVDGAEPTNLLERGTLHHFLMIAGTFI